MSDSRIGRIISNHGAKVALESSNGRIMRASARKKLGLVVCGDWVDYELTGDTAVVTRIHERTSSFERPDRRRRLKPLASNIDQIIIVSAHQPGIDLALIDAYLVSANHMHIDAVLVFNKTDLPHNEKQTFKWCEYYTNIGYTCLNTSITSDGGLNTLREQLKNKTSIFVGQSGVGKSSLLNCLLPEHNVQVGALSEATGLGSHTTTAANLYHFPSGGDLIDSPGVREFATWQYTPEQIRTYFKEFEALKDQCKFNNCMHLKEPQCAVIKAVNNGQIAKWRMENYKKLLAEAQENELYG